MAMTKHGRKCSRCKVVSPDSDYKHTENKTYTRCIPCRKWVAIFTLYRVTEAQYMAMLEKQQGVCAICRCPEPRYSYLPVDHDHGCCAGKHSCGKCVRGLLCSNCNPMVGYSQEDPAVLREAALYIERFYHGSD